ncbi:hypothetical protein T265_08866 [Opisthorchis viverrini]|uniref:Uncharacterized protein n=1 Tax=Opisthorchis viverrini TaxID=6198 RepID=A0A074Z7Z8_OPIVI|nr:hypothetical protein T265_08866 [Opisthorchis viverrini]KER23218.1 hypothetical protein T265_08866 [Opisthorchis viverrini]
MLSVAFFRSTRWLTGCSTNSLAVTSVVQTRPLLLDFPCLGLGNLVVPQTSCFLLVAWQLSAKKWTQKSKRKPLNRLLEQLSNGAILTATGSRYLVLLGAGTPVCDMTLPTTYKHCL